ncbi:MAG: IclR family transcriptional regulator [Caldisphaera sp.]|uniref:IclR family transcriptional regulator n=1 Tax=Caldisphaera sp. TaxID=2060322 RepID=UPI003D0C62E1
MVESEKKQIKSLAKAIEILSLLKLNSNMRLNDISKKINAPKSTTHGLLSTLCDFGFVEKTSVAGEYKLGYKLYELGMEVAKQWKIIDVALPYLKNIVNELNETAHLATLSTDGEVFYIQKYESNRSIKIVSDVGSKLPAHCTGVGKVLLSYLDDKSLLKIVQSKGLKSFTKNTITDFEKLKEELTKIKIQGYAIDNEEIMDGLKCIASPIYDHTGKVFYAISISGPVNRLSGDRFYKALKLIQKTSLEISKNLGFRIDKLKRGINE